MGKKQLLKRAGDAFARRSFQEALDAYLAVLRIDPEEKEAKMGVMLCDLLEESEEEAMALFDYYEVLVQEGEKEPEEIIMKMIREQDELENEINEFLSPLNDRIINEGISYEDFKNFVKERGGFKQAYEDIMFSTKVVITKKEDLFDFIDHLIKHGYIEHVYSYVEDASKLYPADARLQEIFKKLK